MGGENSTGRRKGRKGGREGGKREREREEEERKEGEKDGERGWREARSLPDCILWIQPCIYENKYETKLLPDREVQQSEFPASDKA